MNNITLSYRQDGEKGLLMIDTFTITINFHNDLLFNRVNSHSYTNYTDSYTSYKSMTIHNIHKNVDLRNFSEKRRYALNIATQEFINYLTRIYTPYSLIYFNIKLTNDWFADIKIPNKEEYLNKILTNVFHLLVERNKKYSVYSIKEYEAKLNGHDFCYVIPYDSTYLESLLFLPNKIL